MKNTKKQVARALVLGTVLVGGVSLAQAFYNEAQASPPYLDIPKVVPGRKIQTPGGFPICVCPQLDPENTCFCFY
jgi:hypothetical protein